MIVPDFSLSSLSNYFPKLTRKNLLILVLIFVVYVITARFANQIFVFSGGGRALIWPPAGINIAVLYLLGFVYWPAIALGSIVNTALNDMSVLSTIMIAIGNVLQAIAGAYILRKFGYHRKIRKLRHMALIFVTAFTATVIAPTLGLSVIAVEQNMNFERFMNAWVTWWFGCVLSVAVLTPLITSWSTLPKISSIKKLIKGLVAFVFLSSVGYLYFWEGTAVFLGISTVYFLLLPLGWLGLNLSPRYTTLSIFLLVVIAVTGTFYGDVIIPADRLNQRLFQVQMLTLILSMIFFVIASISEERKRSEESLKDHVMQLEEALETIKHHALHDSLTGLPNRKSLQERFELAKSLADRHNQMLVLMFLDLDQFKNINDTLGHSIGDLVLKKAADRLLETVRAVDTVARLGGDEFIIILNEINDYSDIDLVASKLISSFNAPLEIENHTIHTTASIGISVFPDAGEDMDSLLKSADIALYRAKERGRNRYQFYNEEMQESLHARVSLERDLRHAIEKQQFRLVYQPFINLKTDKLMGAEALIRWEHPVLGNISPSEFIPIAEESGLIVPIGNWLIKRACKQVKAWKKAGLEIPVSINLCAKQLVGDNLIETLKKSLDDCDLSPKCLELEITESIAMQNKEQASQKLKILENMGFGITMDDFGTGYSSLSYLKGFHVHKIKIDQSFVKDMSYDQQDAIIIRTIISMGHTLGLDVCAEGIETPEQKMLLGSMGCDLGQGYFICSPAEAAEFTNWLAKSSVTAQILSLYQNS